jgi:hypothetical protein
MATKPKKTTPAAPAALDHTALLGALVSATLSPTGFMYMSADESGPLVTAGHAEVNAQMIEPATGKQATRATQAGIAAAQGSAPTGFGTPTSTPQTSPAATAAKAAFKLVSSIPIPDSKRGGGGGARPETYPFSTMEVNQAFFIPATAERPNPERSYASTVASARNRFAEPIPGQTRVNRKGKTVPAERYTKDFVIRGIEDGAAAGFGEEFKGVKGAAIWRTV